MNTLERVFRIAGYTFFGLVGLVTLAGVAVIITYWEGVEYALIGT